MTQRRNREAALTDIMTRYGIAPEHCHLFSSSSKFVEVAASLGMQATDLSGNKQLIQSLKRLLKQAAA